MRQRHGHSFRPATTSTFPLPTLAVPKAVQAVLKPWSDSSDSLSKAQQAVRDAEALLSESRIQDSKDVTAAAKAGKSLEGVGSSAVEAQQVLDRATTLVSGLKGAVEETGDDVASVIAANLDAWLKGLAKVEQEAADRYATLLAEAKTLLPVLAEARAAAEFLTDERNNWSGAMVRHGQEPSTAVTVYGASDHKVDAAETLDIALKAADPEGGKGIRPGYTIPGFRSRRTATNVRGIA